MSLAWWATSKDVDLSKILAQGPLCSRQRRIYMTDKGLDRISAIPTPRKVLSVYLQRRGIDIGRKDVLHAQSQGAASFRNAKGQGAAAAEQVRKPDGAAISGVQGPQGTAEP